MLHLRSTVVSEPLLLLFSVHAQLHTVHGRAFSLRDSLAGAARSPPAAAAGRSAVRGGQALPAQRERRLRGQLCRARLLRQEPPERGRRSRSQPGLCGHGVSGAGLGLSALQEVVHVPQGNVIPYEESNTCVRRHRSSSHHDTGQAWLQFSAAKML